MDIRNWSMNQIMQLPDECFGRRWPVFLHMDVSVGGTNWDISEASLPDVTIIWEYSSWSDQFDKDCPFFRLALGDVLPATTAEMDALEPLFRGYGLQGPEPRLISGPTHSPAHLDRLKMPVAANGRRLVAEARAAPTASNHLDIVVVVSSLPTEVPDCLLSAHP